MIEIMKSRDAIMALSALASDARLAVYRLLVKRGPEGYTPSELAGRLDLPAPTLSFHLKGLLQAGLVVSRRERSEEHTSELQSLTNLVCRLLLEKKKTYTASMLQRTACKHRSSLRRPTSRLGRPNER